MEVIINGIKYVPAPDKPTGKGVLDALDIRFSSAAGDDITIRDYLLKLLMTLWEEGEGFSGKRPFGNSGWEYDIFTPLVAGGFITGKLDEDGGIEWYDRMTANAYVRDLILAAFHGARED